MNHGVFVFVQNDVVVVVPGDGASADGRWTVKHFEI